MNFNLYLDEELGTKVTDIAKQTAKSRNAIIREALAEWLRRNDTDWPIAVKQFTSIDLEENFEAYRQELTPPAELDL